ncbi:hypothetical protein [Kitasatospora cheerisanensis]|uniref:hypothetical protein n=1 Tax=Kitasatospora cheerisanensis TaxID=81942 RepID=UPI000689EB3D|nr:hypothetical protein [Kitasatospora cheerisanensis]
MARLIVIVPLVLLVGFKLATWLMERRTAKLRTATEAAKATIARVEEATRPTIYPSEHGLVGRAELVRDPGLTGPDVDAALAALKEGDRGRPPSCWPPPRATTTGAGAWWAGSPSPPPRTTPGCWPGAPSSRTARTPRCSPWTR